MIYLLQSAAQEFIQGKDATLLQVCFQQAAMYSSHLFPDKSHWKSLLDAGKNSFPSWSFSFSQVPQAEVSCGWYTPPDFWYLTAFCLHCMLQANRSLLYLGSEHYKQIKTHKCGCFTEPKSTASQSHDSAASMSLLFILEHGLMELMLSSSVQCKHTHCSPVALRLGFATGWLVDAVNSNVPARLKPCSLTSLSNTSQ